jgi:hypothetical protein
MPKMDKRDYEIATMMSKTRFMTDEEIDESNRVIGIVNRNADDMDEQREKIERYDIAYNGEQEKDENRPNTRVNIIHPNIEGQVADIALQDIGLFVQGQEYTDDQFAEWARSDVEWTIDHQPNLKGVMSRAVRRMLKYGWTFLRVHYNEDMFDGFGLAEITSPYVDRVFIDRKITSPLDLQKAEYIAEVVTCSRTYAEQTYGKDKASAISYGHTDITTESAFTKDVYFIDDDTAWVLILFWDRYDGKLRLREYTQDGLLLWDSMKVGDRKTNQMNSEYTDEPIYKYVENRYPYEMVNCYDEEGTLFGFGDIKLLENLQDALNNMYDNIRLATKPNRIMLDSRSNVDPDSFEEDAYAPIPYDGGSLQGASPVREVSMGTPNSDWWRMIGSLHTEIQRVIRYSELMLGQSGGAGTATEAAIQERQGSRSTSMKQKTMEAALRNILLYALALDLQYRTGKKAMRLNGSTKLNWIDYDMMKNVPVTIPMEAGERKKWIDRGWKPEDIPDTQILEENGKESRRKIEIDLKVSIGSKAPASPAMIANMMTQFAAIQLMSKDGKPRPVIFWEEFRKFVSEYFSLPVDELEVLQEDLAEYEQKQMEMLMQAQQSAQQAEAQKSGQPSIGTPANLGSGGGNGSGIMQGKQDFVEATAQ